MTDRSKTNNWWSDPASREADPDLNSLYEDCDFRGFVAGWALGKGVPLEQAYEFSSYVRYHTEMG